MINLSAINKNNELSTDQKLVARQQAVAKQLGVSVEKLAELFRVPAGIDQIAVKNCENVFGSVTLPVGLAGPMAVQQTFLSDSEAQNKTSFDQVLVPLATTEGALVASVNRGCKAIRLSGGANVMVSYNGMSRAPVFGCKSAGQAHKLVAWFKANQPLVAKWAERTSSHLRLLKIESWVRGRYAFVRFSCDTDQAMGMNMVSIGAQAVWAELQQLIIAGKNQMAELAGVEMVSLSSNMCSDKKAGVVNGLLGRGYFVQAEAVISAKTLTTVLKTNAKSLVTTQVAKNYVGSALAGSTAQNMQVANVVAGLFAATGQDLAHVVDASQATTSIEENMDDEQKVNGGVLVAVTLPSVPVGVVGGGTWLPAQSAARRVFSGESEQLESWQFAGLIGAAALAGELSGMAALSSNQLACAHMALGRG